MALIVVERRVQGARVALEECGYYDHSRRISGVSDDPTVPSGLCASNSTEKYALPITKMCMETFLRLQEQQVPLPHPFENCFVAQVSLPGSKKSTTESLRHLLQTAIINFLRKTCCEHEIVELVKFIPTSWERHGNLVVLPSTSFSSDLWKSHLGSLSDAQMLGLWALISNILKCQRLAMGSHISSDAFRSSTVTLLLGDCGWVDHVDNGIHYVFDVTKCMFSSGNITEKLRLSKLDCRGETVVDLYAGIGYFVLPYLVHTGVKLVHACEWNHHAVEGLKRGLKANGVEDRCIIHFGDNRKAGLTDVADRVNVGLIPSSEEGWPVACAALKQSTGGWLHIHGNVSLRSARGKSDQSSQDQCTDQQELERYLYLLSPKHLQCSSVVMWVSHVVEKLLSFLQQRKSKDECIRHWSVEVKHAEHVKSYAPHISHLVLDVECRPVLS